MTDESIERKALTHAERAVANLETSIQSTEHNANQILVQQTKQAKESLELWRYIHKALLAFQPGAAKQLEREGA